MALDMNGLPISPTFLLGAALYAGVSAFGTGPLIGERLIAKSGWVAQCERALNADIAARRPVPEAVHRTPQIDCHSTLGAMMPEMRELCSVIDRLPIPDPTTEARARKRQAQDALNRRLDRLAAMSGTRCSCAASTLIENERMAFAIHAGSARQMTPAPVRDLGTSLIGALNAAPCASLVEGGQ